MFKNKTLLIFLGLEAQFIGTGAVLLIVGILFQPKTGSQTGPLDPGTNLLLSTIPLTGIKSKIGGKIVS